MVTLSSSSYLASRYNLCVLRFDGFGESERTYYSSPKPVENLICDFIPWSILTLLTFAPVFQLHDLCQISSSHKELLQHSAQLVAFKQTVCTLTFEDNEIFNVQS